MKMGRDSYNNEISMHVRDDVDWFGLCKCGCPLGTCIELWVGFLPYLTIGWFPCSLVFKSDTVTTQNRGPRPALGNGSGCFESRSKPKII